METDSLAAVRLIQMDCSPLHLTFNLIREIMASMEPAENFRICHVMREANQVADGLIKHSLSLESNFVTFDNLPLFMPTAFWTDFSGVLPPWFFRRLGCGFVWGLAPLVSLKKKKRGKEKGEQ